MQDAKLQYGVSKPLPVVIQKHCGMKIHIINFDIETTDIDGCNYCWKQIALPVSVWSYSAIVSAIINFAYSIDEMQAINNNYLRTLDGTGLDSQKREEYLAEHFEMNAYRDHAKTVANELLAYARENNL